MKPCLRKGKQTGVRFKMGKHSPCKTSPPPEIIFPPGNTWQWQEACLFARVYWCYLLGKKRLGVPLRIYEPLWQRVVWFKRPTTKSREPWFVRQPWSSALWLPLPLHPHSTLCLLPNTASGNGSDALETRHKVYVHEGKYIEQNDLSHSAWIFFKFSRDYNACQPPQSSYL